MKPVLVALVIAFLSFLPFHMSRSPEGGKVKLIEVSPEDFNPEPGTEGGTLYYVLSGDPKTLNPALAQETTSTAVIGDVFSGLTRLDLKTMEVRPDLAKRWEVSEDGRVWTFYLHLQRGLLQRLYTLFNKGYTHHKG